MLRVRPGSRTEAGVRILDGLSQHESVIPTWAKLAAYMLVVRANRMKQRIQLNAGAVPTAFIPRRKSRGNEVSPHAMSTTNKAKNPRSLLE